MEAIQITVERQHNGSLLLSTIHNGYYCKQVYYDYTLAEAKALFREYIKKGC